MEYREFKAKTVDEAITLASTEFGCASTELDYEVIEKGSSGFLGIGAKQAVIKAKKKESFLDDIQEYLDNLFKAMDIEAKVTIDYDEAEATMDIDVEGAHNFSLSLQFLTTKAAMFAFAIIPHFDKYASVLPYKPFIRPFYHGF